MESIIDYLKRHLRTAGAKRWEAIAAEAGVAKTLPRKIVYELKEHGPGVLTVQPLIDYFREVDAGARLLPVIVAQEVA